MLIIIIIHWWQDGPVNKKHVLFIDSNVLSIDMDTNVYGFVTSH